MTITFTTVLRRALLAGVVTGVLMGFYLLLVVEPTVNDALILEERTTPDERTVGGDAGDHAGHRHGPLFPRGTQVVGGVAANVVYAVIVAGIFGVVLARCRHRLPGHSDLARSVGLAGTGFTVFALVPALKYPANPPAVGDPATIDERTLQYLACLGVSLLAAVALFQLDGYLRRRTDPATRIVAVTAASVALYATILVALPTGPDSIAAQVPASLVWDFRIRSIGNLALLWTGLGLGTGLLLERWASASAGRDRPSPAAAADESPATMS